MIVHAVQKGGRVQYYTDKSSSPKGFTGILVAFTESCISYKTSHNSKTILVVDENFHRIKTVRIS